MFAISLLSVCYILIFIADFPSIFHYLHILKIFSWWSLRTIIFILNVCLQWRRIWIEYLILVFRTWAADNQSNCRRRVSGKAQPIAEMELNISSFLKWSSSFIKVDLIYIFLNDSFTIFIFLSFRNLILLLIFDINFVVVESFKGPSVLL